MTLTASVLAVLLSAHSITPKVDFLQSVAVLTITNWLIHLLVSDHYSAMMIDAVSVDVGTQKFGTAISISTWGEAVEAGVMGPEEGVTGKKICWSYA